MSPPTLTPEKMYLTLEHRTAGRALIPNGLSILDEEALVLIISANPDVCMLTKPIKPGCTCVEICKGDLVPEELRAKYTVRVKGEGEEVPWKEFLGHGWEGHSFDEVVILTLEDVVAKIVGEVKGKGKGMEGKPGEKL